MWFAILIAALSSYLLGNLNGSVCISALMEDDVRKHGSGNAGLTNFFRNYGFVGTGLVLLVDMIKTVLGCLSASLMLERFGYGYEGMMLGAVAVSLGHDFPALLGFRGGKGILSGVTVALMLDWKIGLFVFGIFLVAYWLTHYVSLGSILSSGSFGPIYAIFHWDQKFAVCVGFFLSFLIVWLHRANIVRLLKGQERKTNLLGKGNQK